MDNECIRVYTCFLSMPQYRSACDCCLEGLCEAGFTAR